MPKAELYRVQEDTAVVGEHTHSEADVLDLEHDAVKLKGNDISSTPPTSGQVLTWDGSAWAPAAAAAGGGVPWIVTIADPPSTGWSWVNQGNATLTDQISSGAGLYLEDTDHASSNLRLQTRSAPSAPYTVDFGFYYQFIHGDCAPFVGFRNSSSGRLAIFTLRSTATQAEIRIQHWTSATVFSTNQLTQDNFYNTTFLSFIRLEDDGSTNRKYHFSINGINWLEVHSESRTLFFTPDEVVFGVLNNSSINTGIGLIHYKEA